MYLQKSKYNFVMTSNPDLYINIYNLHILTYVKG